MDNLSLIQSTNLSRIQSILDRCRYKDWSFILDQAGGYPVLSVAYASGDEIRRGRNWMLDPDADTASVASAALKAVLDERAGEVLAQFSYRGVAVFGPALDLDARHREAVAAGLQSLDPWVDLQADSIVEGYLGSSPIPQK